MHVNEMAQVEAAHTIYTLVEDLYEVTFAGICSATQFSLQGLQKIKGS